jgi:hypothetical protein
MKYQVKKVHLSCFYFLINEKLMNNLKYEINIINGLLSSS